MMCEDGIGDQHILGTTEDGKVFKFAKNTVNIGTPEEPEYGELAGAGFSADGRTMFFNVYNPGITYAITARRRALNGGGVLAQRDTATHGGFARRVTTEQPGSTVARMPSVNDGQRHVGHTRPPTRRIGRGSGVGTRLGEVTRPVVGLYVLSLGSSVRRRRYGHVVVPPGRRRGVPDTLGEHRSRDYYVSLASQDRRAEGLALHIDCLLLVRPAVGNLSTLGGRAGAERGRGGGCWYVTTSSSSRVECIDLA